jgi:sporulation protein YlmC with PRC-barrel domain
MIDQGSVPSLMGSTVRDDAGDKIGKVGQVYLDDTTGQPEWVTVRTGLFGTRESFVPLAAARVEGDELVVDVSKDRVKDAPQIDEDGHLSEQQEAELYAYYGVSPGAFGQDTGPTEGGYAAGTSGTDVADEYAGTSVTPETAHAPGTSYPGAAATSHAGAPGDVTTTEGAYETSRQDDAMARAEEEAAPRTEPGRARLRRYAAPESGDDRV